MHATGPIAIASIQVASRANSIHRGKSSVKRTSPTHGGRWLAQTNYDALMTHHTTENTDIQLIWLFICDVNVNISTVFVHILELGTNATETIMPGTWSVLDPCLQNDITMVEVGQQCEPNTTLAAVTKAGGLLTVEDKSASLWLCCSRYLLGEQLFRERGPSSECIHMNWSDSPRCSWAKFYFTRSVQKYL